MMSIVPTFDRSGATNRGLILVQLKMGKREKVPKKLQINAEN